MTRPALQERCEIVAAIHRALGRPQLPLVVETASKTMQTRAAWFDVSERCQGENLSIAHPVRGDGTFLTNSLLISVSRVPSGWSFNVDRITLGVDAPEGYAADIFEPIGEWHGEVIRKMEGWTATALHGFATDGGFSHGLGIQGTQIDAGPELQPRGGK